MGTIPSQSTELTILGAITKPHQATVLQESDTNFRISSHSDLPPGTLVRLKTADGFVCGQVLSCRQDSHKYLAQVERLVKTNPAKAKPSPRRRFPESVLPELMSLNSRLLAFEAAASDPTRDNPAA